MEIPDPVASIGERIQKAGGELYIVGGWVRDRLRGIDCNDVDLATSLPPVQVKSSIQDIGSIYDLGEKFGTVGIRIGDYAMEITTFRREQYTPGSRHPRVSPASGILEDLARRDFTINAIALSVAPTPGRLFDPFEGRRDIERRLIRTPGSPTPPMEEDPLRMMRAVRFAAQLDYRIDPELLETLSKKGAQLEQISMERRRDEFEKILISPRPDIGIGTLVETDLMDYLAPEVSAMKGVSQPPRYHRADVLEHTLLTLTYIEEDPLLRRAALFHDLGKPRAKITEPKTRFPDHHRLGESLTREVMKRMRYPNREIIMTAFLVRRHMRPIQYRGNWTDATVRRMVRDCTMLREGEVVVPLDAVISLARADILAGSLQTIEKNLELLRELERKIEKLKDEQEMDKIISPLDGNELMAILDRPPGPWIRKVKDYLTDLVVAGELDQDDKKGAEKVARELVEQENGPHRNQ